MFACGSPLRGTFAILKTMSKACVAAAGSAQPAAPQLKPEKDQEQVSATSCLISAPVYRSCSSE